MVTDATKIAARIQLIEGTLPQKRKVLDLQGRGRKRPGHAMEIVRNVHA